MNRVFFFDIDGTLYRPPIGIPLSVVEAFKRLRKQGDYVFFSTGRTRPSIEPEFKMIDYDGYVGGNGSTVVMHGQELLNLTIKNDLVQKIIECTDRAGYEYVLEGNKSIYSDAKDANTPLFSYSFYKNLLGDDMKSPKEETPQVNKLSIILNNNPFDKTFYSSVLDRVSMVEHKNLCVEMAPKYCTKATGAALILKVLGLKAENCYAFGDSLNDLDILDFAGTSVAMGDAPDEAKAKATYITDTLESNGICRALDTLGIWDESTACE